MPDEEQSGGNGVLSQLGPGLITGASNDDPTAIATYSQAGAAFGYGLCWLSLMCFPLMAAIQEISGRLGRTTGHGLAGNIRRHYPRGLLLGAVALLFTSNVVAIGADLAAMADIVRILIGGPQLLYVVLFGALTIGLQIFMRYERYVALLKWTTLSLLSYVAAALAAEVDWPAALAALVPRPSLTRDFAINVVAIFGVALSPYLVFWQSAQEAEDQRVTPEREPLVRAHDQAPSAIARIRLDTLVGMAVATLVGLSIMITTAATLHASGQTTITTSVEAANALRPVAGNFAFALFSLGIVGTGLLAVPVLAGSAAYALGEARRWRVGLSHEPSNARAFYLSIGFAGLLGVALNLIGIPPMTALYWSAVLNGFVAVPMVALMVTLASKTSVMGPFAIGLALRMFGWLTVACLTIGAITLCLFTVL